MMKKPRIIDNCFPAAEDRAEGAANPPDHRKTKGGKAMIKNLLLCTDGSEFANVAADYAIWLAQQWGARVVLLHVTDSRLLEGPLMADLSGALGAQPYRAFLPQLQEVYRQKAEMILSSVSGKCRDAGVKTDPAHKTGGLVDSILQEERRAELVVMGQHGEHAQWASGMLGSSVERVVRRSVKPCLVTPAAFREIGRVLAAYDGSKESSKSLSVAFDVTESLGASLTIVTVCQRADEEKASRALQEAASMAETHGLKPRCELLHGDAENEILKFADAETSDLIVMGAYGHTRIREWILGSTTTAVIRRSKIPVLLTR
jgi:nucleotide-binding universal stress UspA family protein